MGLIIPNEFQNRGPVPGSLYFTFLFEEDASEGALVAIGSAYPKVKKWDAGDVAIGWAQGSMVADKYGDIVPFGPVFKSDVDAASDSLVYGDILAHADDGKVKKASGSTVQPIAGVMISKEAAASGQALYIAVVSTPDPITT